MDSSPNTKDNNPRINDAMHDPESKEYKLSTSVAFTVSDLISWAVGDVLDIMDAALPENNQTDALKKLVKDRIYEVTREIQHQVYYAFGQEDYQYGDSYYIRKIVEGREDQNP